VSGCTSTNRNPAGVAFNSIAEQYDDIFTRSLIGRAQRDAVWDVLRETFRAGQQVLELNCGTGEDALFLSRMGVAVVACDASEEMIAVAARRMASEPRNAQVRLEVRATEQIGQAAVGPCDGILSNFSGLNCVADLAAVGRRLALIAKPGAHLVFCMSSRFCLWECLWYLAHGQPKRAMRRWKGKAIAHLGDVALEIQYPNVRQMRRSFAPYFKLRRLKGIGVTVPPSYLEHLARRFPDVLRGLAAIDCLVSSRRVFRVIGDHVLLGFERTTV
jgi:ubiquinone/menaquinone biosynthesis C-methylase UbiE